MVYITKETLGQWYKDSQNPRVNKTTEHSDFMSSPTESKCENEAFKKIERLVKVRDRSVAEVTMRLEKDSYSSECIHSAVQRALRCGYLDDVRFADVLIRSRLRARKGLAGIVSELKRHGINPEVQLPNFPDAYLSLFPSQKDSAIALLCKKPPKSKNKLQAAYAKLVRSGYSSSLASEAAREWYKTQA